MRILTTLNHHPLRIHLFDLIIPAPFHDEQCASATLSTVVHCESASSTSSVQLQLGDEWRRTSVGHQRRRYGPDGAVAGNLGRHEQRRHARVNHAISDDGQADDHFHRGPHLVTLIAQFAVVLEGAGLLPSRRAVVLKPWARDNNAATSERTDGLSVTMRAVRESRGSRAVGSRRRCPVRTGRLLLVWLHEVLLKLRRPCVDDASRPYIGIGAYKGCGCIHPAQPVWGSAGTAKGNY